MRRSRIRVKSPKVARLDNRCKNALLDLRRVAATERKKRGRLNEVPRLIQFLAVASVFLPQKRVIMTLEGTHLVHLLPCNFFFFFLVSDPESLRPRLGTLRHILGIGRKIYLAFHTFRCMVKIAKKKKEPRTPLPQFISLIMSYL